MKGEEVMALLAKPQQTRGPGVRVTHLHFLQVTLSHMDFACGCQKPPSVPQSSQGLAFCYRHPGCAPSWKSAGPSHNFSHLLQTGQWLLYFRFLGRAASVRHNILPLTIVGCISHDFGLILLMQSLDLFH